VIETGVQAMINAAVQILEKKQKGHSTRLMLMSGEARRDEDDVGKDQMHAVLPRK
jgi:hypothetical protein